MIYLLSHILDQSAQRFPNKEALRFNDRSLTYVEWLRRADALAAILVDQGVQRGDRVGVYLNKSLETLIAIYGIWKAGAAYVPLDPNAPVARLQFVLSDCAIRHLITHESKAAGLVALTTETPLECVIGVSTLGTAVPRCIPWSAINSVTLPAPRVLVMEQDLAYVMYTSGSTGTPKGLMHTHYSGLSYARLSAAQYQISHTDRLSNHSPLHFDMSTLDYFTGPLCGATTVIIPEAYTKLPASTSKLVQDERLTIWYSVTTAIVQMVSRGVLEKRDLRALRWILYGGEPFPTRFMHDLMRLVPTAQIGNVYGPAEVNQCTHYTVPKLPDDYEASIPIGHVWANSEGLLLGDDDTPVTQGEIGELVVRTPTMMRGYWGRPDLNARAFYRRKTFDHYEDVFYRTGDLMKLDEDGLLRFYGRKDRQIKTRGYRVELDEVENALAAHPAVAECAVFAVPDDEGSSLVEAAVILKYDASAQEHELKGAVAARLPPYAVPAVIHVLSDFPRTGTGKIDRRALRENTVAAKKTRLDREVEGTRDAISKM
jgi:amino acid adenylation domain-containing protein